MHFLSKLPATITAKKARGEIYTGKVYAIQDDGSLLPKKGNNGTSTFFPKDWDTARIKLEVEHAVRENHGALDAAKPNGIQYGYSRNKKIKIGFYYDKSTGSINSYFPQIDAN